jgi:hypothetical protein
VKTGFVSQLAGLVGKKQNVITFFFGVKFPTVRKTPKFL